MTIHVLDQESYSDTFENYYHSLIYINLTYINLFILKYLNFGVGETLLNCYREHVIVVSNNSSGFKYRVILQIS